MSQLHQFDDTLLSVEQCFFARPPGHNPREPRPPVTFVPMPLFNPDGLRHAILKNRVISRGLLYDLTIKNLTILPNRAIDCIERILLRSRAPYVPVDRLERETSLCFWEVDKNLKIALLGDWSQLLCLVPDFIILMPSEIQLIHNARMEGVRKRDALMLSMNRKETGTKV